MEISSVQKLCLHLISSAFQRCRQSEDLCRLSVVLNRSTAASPIVRVSISDTGIGSCLEEFQDLKIAGEFLCPEKWDGLLLVRTTSISDDEIYHYHLNFKESLSTRRLNRLPSNLKNGAKFSGTEVNLATTERIDVLLAEVNCFFHKMLILNIPNIVAELVIEQGDAPGSQHGDVFLANEYNSTLFSASSVERLKSGLEAYVLTHGKSLKNKCDSCFPTREPLKIGSGVACSMESHRSAGQIMEVVIIISESSVSSIPCLRLCNTKTEVLYFKDFSPSSVSASFPNALASINWRSYGLNLGSVVDQGGSTLLEWENLPQYAHIDMVLHCYHKQYPTSCHAMIPPAKLKTQPDRNLIKKAVKLALDDLKERHCGLLLSSHARKICSYAPDLARTIAGLIVSSNDSHFQRECISLLGLHGQNVASGTIEDCVKEKIMAVIETNDRKPQKSKETAPYLFEDDCLPEPYFQNEECEEVHVIVAYTFGKNGSSQNRDDDSPQTGSSISPTGTGMRMNFLSLSHFIVQ
ncbi:hypothetical protein SLE2022_377560 [Rubroshorea leprosula]